MSETLNAQDIAKKLQEQLTSLSATVDTHEVSTVDEVGRRHRARLRPQERHGRRASGVQELRYR